MSGLTNTQSKSGSNVTARPFMLDSGVPVFTPDGAPMLSSESYDPEAFANSEVGFSENV